MIDWMFHFSQPELLLWGLVLIPVKIWLSYQQKKSEDSRITAYADAHLLPYLTGSRALEKSERTQQFIQWAILWCCLVVAMAGPRWDYQESSVFYDNTELVIVLDLSQSMNVEDESPSRLVRAKQEIADLLSEKGSLSVGLVVFGSIAHVVQPLTQDKQAITRQLPLLTTDLLVYTGSHLNPAINRAMSLLSQDNKDISQHILLITDGDFAIEDTSLTLRKLRSKHIFLHILGLGSSDGGVIPLKKGTLLDAKGAEIISRLDFDQLVSLGNQTQGLVQKAHFREQDTQKILHFIKRNTTFKQQDQITTRVWNEAFYWLLIPFTLFLLPQYRRLWRADELRGKT